MADYIDLSWVGKTIEALGHTPEERAADYESRKLALIEPEDNAGIGVSTCWVDDFTCYETALIDANGTHPVEHYLCREDADRGHERWVIQGAECGKVIELGTPDGLVANKEIQLARMRCR